MSDPEREPSPGKRPGHMMAIDPELTGVREDEAGREFIRRFTEYATADGFGAQAIVTRLEQLKFETIVQGRSYADVLADLEKS